MPINNKLVEAIIALHGMQEHCLFGIYSNPDVMQRCDRWLDAILLPPPPPNEEDRTRQG